MVHVTTGSTGVKEKHSNKGALTSSAHPELRLFVKSDVIWILFTLPLVNIQSQLLSCPVPPMPAVFLLFFFFATVDLCREKCHTL